MKNIAMVAAIILVGSVTGAQAETVTVYTSRIESMIKPLFDAYTRETGVEIRFISDKEGPLLARLEAEGRNTQADLLMTVDAGNLWQARKMGLLQPVHSTVLQQNIPAHLRDPGDEWFGLSVRARTIFYNTQKVKPADLSTYEDLATARWKGRLCLRTSKKVYNQSLVAMLIAQRGEAQTEKIVKGWVNNLAMPVFSDDTKMLEAVGAGKCDVGIANTYYYGRLMAKSSHLPIGIFWSDQNMNGVHVNVSGAGVTKYAKNTQGAVKLLEWLSSVQAQNLLAGVNMEYPANPQVRPDPAIVKWGTFKQNLINVSKAGELQGKATKLMDRAGYK